MICRALEPQTNIRKGTIVSRSIFVCSQVFYTESSFVHLHLDIPHQAEFEQKLKQQIPLLQANYYLRSYSTLLSVPTIFGMKSSV